MNRKPLYTSREGTQALFVRVITNNRLTHRIIAKDLWSPGKITVLPYENFTGVVPGDIQENTIVLVDHLALSRADTEMLISNAGQRRLVFLSDSPADEICQLLLIGIRGFVRYEHIKVRLARAIKLVAQGHLYVPRDIMERYVSYTQDKLRTKRSTYADLTPRQRQIMALLERRCANKEISSILHISENTVKFHLAKLFHRLGIHDRHQLADLVRSDANQRAIVSETGAPLKNRHTRPGFT